MRFSYWAIRLGKVHVSQRQIDAYLDGELDTRDIPRLLAHCKDCITCSNNMRERTALLDMIASARVRATAPHSLRQQVLLSLISIEDSASFSAAPSWISLMPNRMLLPTLGGAALAIGGLCLALLLRANEKEVRFVQTAVDMHILETRGALTLGVNTASTRELTDWFGPRLPFELRLPVYRENAQKKSQFALIGGSLAVFEQQRAAYIAYGMQNEVISVLIVPADQVTASGGQTTRIQNISFHYLQKQQLSVFTWSVHHFTYALVSNVRIPGRRSCAVCHEGFEDHTRRSRTVSLPFNTRDLLMFRRMPALENLTDSFVRDNPPQEHFATVRNCLSSPADRSSF